MEWVVAVVVHIGVVALLVLAGLIADRLEAPGLRRRMVPPVPPADVADQETAARGEAALPAVDGAATNRTWPTASMCSS